MRIRLSAIPRNLGRDLGGQIPEHMHAQRRGDPCPHCGGTRTGCIASVLARYGRRRQRCCGDCGKRWATLELVVQP